MTEPGHCELNKPLFHYEVSLPQIFGYSNRKASSPGEMAQWVRALGAKFAYLSLIPGIQMVERESWLLQVVL